MTLVEEYTLKSENMLRNDEEIVNYENELKNRTIHLNHLIATSSILELLIHPVKLIRTNQAIKKTQKIQDEYLKIRNSGLVENITEETGELGDDLEYAVRISKPTRIKWFIEKHPLDNDCNSKKLLKTRK